MLQPNYYQHPLFDLSRYTREQAIEFIEFAYKNEYVLIPIPKMEANPNHLYTFLSFYPIKPYSKIHDETFRVVQDIAVPDAYRTVIYNKIYSKDLRSKYSSMQGHTVNFSLKLEEFLQFNYIVLEKHHYEAYRFALDYSYAYEHKEDKVLYEGRKANVTMYKFSNNFQECNQVVNHITVTTGKYNSFFMYLYPTGSTGIKNYYCDHEYIRQFPGLHTQYLYRKNGRLYKDNKQMLGYNHLPTEIETLEEVYSKAKTVISPVIFDLLMSTQHFSLDYDETSPVYSKYNRLLRDYPLHQNVQANQNSAYTYNAVLGRKERQADDSVRVCSFDNDNYELKPLNQFPLRETFKKEVEDYMPHIIKYMGILPTSNNRYLIYAVSLENDWFTGLSAPSTTYCRLETESTRELYEYFSEQGEEEDINRNCVNSLNSEIKHYFSSSYGFYAFMLYAPHNLIAIRSHKTRTKRKDRLLHFVDVINSSKSTLECLRIDFKRPLLKQFGIFDRILKLSLSRLTNPDNRAIQEWKAFKYYYQEIALKILKSRSVFQTVTSENTFASWQLNDISETYHIQISEEITGNPHPPVKDLCYNIHQAPYYEPVNINQVMSDIQDEEENEARNSEPTRPFSFTPNNTSLLELYSRLIENHQNHILRSSTPEEYLDPSLEEFTLKEDFFQYKAGTKFTKQQIENLFLKYNHHPVRIPGDVQKLLKNYLYNLFK